MSIRNLGDWSPLGLDSDPIHADPDAVSAAQTRYEGIATTIDDAVTRLQKIVDTNSESLVGQYVEGLKSNASSLKDNLSKAAVRYHDVANQIKTYEPELDDGLSETAGALNDARSAVDAQNSANAMPDPQKNPDGTLTSDGQQQQTSKTNAQNSADDQLNAAKSRLNNAMDNLNAAGKRFGDAVNCNNYNDGLTDSAKDKLDAILKILSTIFGAIGMFLAGLALLIPGLDVIVLAGVAAGIAALGVDSKLYADGQGSVLDVVLGALGIGLAGVGAGIAQLAKGLSASAKAAAEGVEAVGDDAPTLDFAPGAFGEDIELGDLAPRPAGTAGGGDGAPNVIATNNFITPQNAATDWANISDWYNNPLTNAALGKLGGVTPEVGFWESAGMQWSAAKSMWGSAFSNPAGFFAEWGGVLGGWSGYRDLASVMGAVDEGISPLWFAWGGINGVFGLAYGLGYTGGRLTQSIPDVNPS